MTRMKDPLRPSLEQSSIILDKSRRSWGSLLASAVSVGCLPLSCTNIGSLLHQTPSLPSRSEIEELAGDTSLYLEGFSVWDIGSPKSDLAGKTKKSRIQKVVIASNRSRFCHISNDFSSGWPGFEGLSCDSSTGSYVFAFVLGWSYILSARLVELRRESDQDKISYTEQQAPLDISEGPLSPNDGFTMPIGGADLPECRWWAAILANGCGWQTVLCRSGREFYPSWSCHLKCDERFQIRPDRLMGCLPVLGRPPSSTQAQEYLYNFAKLHNAYDQLLAAFVATLTIPEHARFGAPIALPRPKPLFTNGEATHSTLLGLLPSTDHLPRFMAFSCVPNTITACMLGCLWEPRVACNLVSQWLYPVLQEVVPRLTQERQLYTIVRIMAARRPNSAPLWLGSAITGLLPRLFEIAGEYLPSISLEATQWTRSSQSFMDPHYHRKSRIYGDDKGQKFIRREDEFRLLYLTDIESNQYASPPLCPWPPFGMTDLKTTAIEVRKHAFCGHQLTYNHWVWEGNDGVCVYDHGIAWKSNTIRPRSIGHRMMRLLFRFRAKICIYWRGRHARFPSAPMEVCSSEKLSRAATRNIFTWTLSDGIKPEESAMWTHEWLEGLIDAEDEGHEDVELSLVSLDETGKETQDNQRFQD